MLEEIWNYGVPYALGFFVALVWGQIVTGRVNRILRGKLKLGNDTAGGPRQSRVLGHVESVLYIGAFLIGRPEFVAVWLGLKTVVRWRHWESDIPLKKEKDKPQQWVFGRDAYNLFLISNGLVLLFAAAGWQLIELASACDWPKVYAGLLGLLVGSILLLFIVSRSGSYETIPQGDARLRRPTAEQKEVA